MEQAEMKFRTEVILQKSETDISHQTKIIILGSCFANSIGQKFIDNKFDVNLNPFGTLYNPISILKTIKVLMDNKKFTEEDIFIDKGVYNSFYHHSSFSDKDKEQCLHNINIKAKEAAGRLREADILFVTFGTSYVYQYIKTKEIVGNCHKLPSTDFTRYRLTIADIAEQWEALIRELKEQNPKLSIIFTVSPIRHLRDGAHDNQLSKSILLLAIDQLKNKFAGVYYFPSYEIILDDLRDYRFYEQDMVHPGFMAIEYIWNILGEVYFSKETRNIIKEWEKLRKALEHKPLITRSEEHIHFLKQTLLKLDAFERKFPFISVQKERMIAEKQINN